MLICARLIKLPRSVDRGRSRNKLELIEPLIRLWGLISENLAHLANDGFGHLSLSPEITGDANLYRSLIPDKGDALSAVASPNASNSIAPLDVRAVDYDVVP